MTETPLPRLRVQPLDLGQVSLPDDRLWPTMLNLSEVLEERAWALIGGQMVALHGLALGRTPIRFSSDLDVIANLVLRPSSLTTCAAHVRSLGFAPRIVGKDAMEIDGGWRALQSTGLMPVMFGSRSGQVPMPDLGGALVIKARAAVADSRDPQRHLFDLAFLLSLADNPRKLRERLSARDRSHLRRLNLEGDTRQAPWIVLTDRDDRSNAAEAYLSLTRH
ncbi:hypothetical protein [Nonomuraea glycinis]|uniref:hypothetical protein n=1 Tax=Nonomuraea glycinis TaxID=2047744 RepID=UPI0033A71E1B